MKNRKFWIALLAGVMAALMLITLIIGILPARASAASSSEIQQQLDELEKQNEEIQAKIDELNSQMQDNMSEIEEVIAQKSRTEQQVALLNEQISNMNDQIASYNVLIADKQDELDAAKARLSELSEQNRERIRAMEENGTLSYWSVLFKANSFADLLDRLNMIEEIAAADKRRMQELSDAANLVATTQAELTAEKTELEKSRSELEATQALLEQKQAEANDLLADLNSRGQEYLDWMNQAEDAQNEFMREIAAKEAELSEALDREYWATYVPPATTKPPANSGGTTDPSPNAPNTGGWLTPVPYYVLTSPFGWREHPMYGGQRFHEGVDLACNLGTPIYATRSGVVITASYNDSAGYYVTIDHLDNFHSVYFHMTHYIVKAGDYVSQGQVIGYVGTSGASTGAHLHFGISYNGSYVDPMKYIG